MPRCIKCNKIFPRSKRFRGKSYYRTKCCWECLPQGKTFKCLLCGRKSYVSNKSPNGYFKRHKYCPQCVPSGVNHRSVTSVGGSEFKCPICNKKYIYKRGTHNSSSRQCASCRNRNKFNSTKIKLVKYKGGRCEKCGYSRCAKALTFHHINPDNKSFEIAPSMWKSFDKLKKEVDKCILVCSRCHTEIHEGLIDV